MTAAGISGTPTMPRGCGNKTELHACAEWKERDNGVLSAGLHRRYVMATNTKPKTISDSKTEWSIIISLLSFGVALFGLCVAIFGAWYAYTSSKSSVTRQIIASFNSAAVTLPTASECFIFSNQVDEDRFYDLLGNRPTQFDFTAPAEDHLARCLQTTSPTNLDHASRGAFFAASAA